jgi:dihydroflavonol-4-reductase
VQSESARSLTICVTGASGYIGAHVVRELLERGHRVRATVRDPSDVAKTAHLTALPGAERLEIVRGQLLDPQEWPGTLDDADALVHCATAVLFRAQNPKKDIVDVAVDGTRNVLSAAARSPRLGVVVQMSSIAAMMSHGKPRDHVYSADDWCEDATVEGNPYALAKTLSEKLAGELARGGPDAPGFRLVSLNPGYVLGPLLTASHARTSPSIVRDIARRAYPGCPPLNFNLVDVRDVATASARAIEMPDLSGRFPLVEGRYWWRAMSIELAKHFPERRITTRKLPTALIYLRALFDRRVSLRFLRQHLNRAFIVPGDDAARSLGMSYLGFERMLVDTVRSLIELGAVE